jgi:hypothetical protein
VCWFMINISMIIIIIINDHQFITINSFLSLTFIVLFLVLLDLIIIPFIIIYDYYYWYYTRPRSFTRPLFFLYSRKSISGTALSGRKPISGRQPISGGSRTFWLVERQNVQRLAGVSWKWELNKKFFSSPYRISTVLKFRVFPFCHIYLYYAPIN